MDKNCPHCLAQISDASRREFIRRQYLEFMFCEACEEKFYMIIPRENNMKHAIVTGLAFFLPLVIAMLVVLGSFSLAMIGFSKALIFAAAFAVGGVFFVYRILARKIHWTYAAPQISPFVD